MYLIAGLGNPQARYANNRHNVGFMVAEELAKRWNLSFSSRRFDSLQAKGPINGHESILIKPMNYMNRSGAPVSNTLRYHKLDPAQDLIIIHDELDLAYGVIRIKKGGGTAGHNGLRSIAANLGSTDFIRLRFGIGRPPSDLPEQSVSNYVLSDFSSDETQSLPSHISCAADAVEMMLSHGILTAMNRYHVTPQE